MVTEIVTFQLNTSTTLSDPTSPAGTIIREVLMTKLTANGAHHGYYGQFIEKPDTAIIFIHWDSLDDHKKFISSSDYATHVKHLESIAKPEAPVAVLHVPFSPQDNVSCALGADANSDVGATEVVFFYFPSTLTPNQRATIMSDHVGKMRPVMERSEALAVYDGWALEESVPNPLSEAMEKTCQVYVNVVGWVDVEAHMRIQGSDDFGANIHHLLGIKEMLHTEFFHVSLLAA